MQSQVDLFLSKFVRTPKGTSPEVLIRKITHYIGVCNRPQSLYPQAGTFELRHISRNARQNLRRLLSKHPELVSTVTRLMEQSGGEQ